MGFFDYLMRGIGFETDSDFVQPKTANKRKARKEVHKEFKDDPQNAEIPEAFSLPIYDASKETEPQIQYESTQSTISTAKNVIVYNPKTQTDVKNLVDFLRRKEPIVVNFGFLPQGVASNMIAFISGALYALRGSIHPITGNLYLLTPEGVNILVPKDEEKA